MIKRFLEHRRRKALVKRLEAVVAAHKRPEPATEPTARYTFDNRPAPFSR